MTDPVPSLDDSAGRFRQTVYWLLILSALAATAGRLCAAHRTHIVRRKVTDSEGRVEVKPVLLTTPLLSANDRSRWCTIRSLVDRGTYVIDASILDPKTRKRHVEWYTIDMVRHRGWDGKEHYYSSKPPILATVLAVPYWLVHQVTGARIEDHTAYMVRLTLAIANLLPLLLLLWLIKDLVERYGETDWGRMLVMATACFGTYLTTFSVTLNNHLPAAVCVAVAVHVSLPVLIGDRSQAWWRFAVAGATAALTVANELPGLSFCTLLGAALLYRSPLRTLGGFLPAAVLVAAAYFGTNYLAHQSWRPPYLHRSDGEVIATLELEQVGPLAKGTAPAALREAITKAGVPLSSQSLVLDSVDPNRWVIWDRDGHDRLALKTVDEGRIDVHRWDNWYDYSASYWTDKRKVGVDRGEPSRALYAIHMLVGHHGIFSLTPMWLVSVLGIAIGLSRWRRCDPLAGVAAATLLLSAVCIAFYIARPQKDRNYGGITSGFRWLFWLIPLWLITAQRGADYLAASRWGRATGLAALAVSIFSASYNLLNPWTHPWLYDYWLYLGWADE